MAILTDIPHDAARAASPVATTLLFPAPPFVTAWNADIARPAGTLVSRHIANARALANDAFVEAIADAYKSLWQQVSQTQHPHIVRFWNGVGGIHDRVDAGMDRYMLFNAGRYRAMRDHFGDGVDLASVAASASGVGIAGDDLIIHALSMADAGTSVQNPRQTPAVRYSKRFGPLPPCFARATRVEFNGRPVLLVAGTAAILGEDSLYANDLDHQLGLTVENLSAVVDAASGRPTAQAALTAFTSLRVYLPRAGDQDRIEAALRPRLRDGSTLEFVPAQLCRRELLIEIEGVADLSAD